MKHYIKILIISTISLVSGTHEMFSQKNYLAEIGLHGGASPVWNRNSDSWTYDMGAMTGLLLRYKTNDRINEQLNFEISSANFKGVAGRRSSIEFNHIFNMLEYGKLDYKLYSKNYSPYLFTGLGAAFFSSQNVNPESALFLPLGIGMKVKMKNRLNFNIQFTHRFFLSSQKETTEYPDYNFIRNNTNILNNSQISSFSIGLAYDFWEKPCDCMKVSNKNKKKH